MINYEAAENFFNNISKRGIISQFSFKLPYFGIQDLDINKTYDVYDIGCGYGGCALMANKFLKVNKTYLIDPLETGKYIENTTKEIIVKTYDEVLEKEGLPNNYVRLNDITEIDKIKSKHNIFFIDTMDNQRDFFKVLKIGIKRGDVFVFKKTVNYIPEYNYINNKTYKIFFLIKFLKKFLSNYLDMSICKEYGAIKFVAKKDFSFKKEVKLLYLKNKIYIREKMYDYVKNLCNTYGIDYNLEEKYKDHSRTTILQIKLKNLALSNKDIYNEFEKFMEESTFEMYIGENKITI